MKSNDMKKNVGTLRMWLVALGFVLAFVGLSSSGDLSSVFSEQVSPTQDLSSSSSSGAKEEARGFEPASSSANGDAPGLELPVAKTKLSQTIKHRTAYTVSYNHDTRQPNWVAWALTRAHASGNLKRGDFEDDMDMPSPKGMKADYYNSGFDRGHLCPAGDNKWSQKAMDECFLMTNMCPQTHALNAGIWNSIEQQCRTWAKKYGKVYIVCGPIFLNKQHRKLGKNKVVVPDAFFKVILRTGKNPQAIGFICRNQSEKGLQKKDFVNSVDEVERITGYDFFSKLPDNIEKKVEAKADISQW